MASADYTGDKRGQTPFSPKGDRTPWLMEAPAVRGLSYRYIAKGDGPRNPGLLAHFALALKAVDILEQTYPESNVSGP